MGTRWAPRKSDTFSRYSGFLGIILQGGLIGRLVKWLGERTMVWTGFAVNGGQLRVDGIHVHDPAIARRQYAGCV